MRFCADPPALCGVVRKPEICAELCGQPVAGSMAIVAKVSPAQPIAGGVSAHTPFRGVIRVSFYCTHFFKWLHFSGSEPAILFVRVFASVALASPLLEEVFRAI